MPAFRIRPVVRATIIRPTIIIRATAAEHTIRIHTATRFQVTTHIRIRLTIIIQRLPISRHKRLLTATR